MRLNEGKQRKSQLVRRATNSHQLENAPVLYKQQSHYYIVILGRKSSPPITMIKAETKTTKRKLCARPAGS